MYQNIKLRDTHQVRNRIKNRYNYQKLEKSNTEIRWYWYGLAIASFYIPQSYAITSTMHSFWIAYICITSSFFTISYLKSCRITARWIFLSGFYIIYYAGSTILSNSIYASIKDIPYTSLIAGIGIISIVEYGISRDREQFIKGFIAAGIVLCTVHYISYIIYRNIEGGMRAGVYADRLGRTTTQHWFFLGHDNGSFSYFLPVSAYLWYAYFEIDNKYLFTAILFTGCSIYMYFDLWSVAAMVCFIVFIIYTLYIYIKYKSNESSIFRMNYRFSCIIGIALVTAITWAHLSGLLYKYIEYYGKTITSNSRLLIWQLSIVEISNNLIFGLGYEPSIITVSRIGINHCHNLLLQILYQGGIVSFIVFIIGVLHPNPKDYQYNYGKQILYGSIVVYFLNSSFDWYPSFVTPLAIFILASSKDIVKSTVK